MTKLMAARETTNVMMTGALSVSAVTIGAKSAEVRVMFLHPLSRVNVFLPDDVSPKPFHQKDDYRPQEERLKKNPE
jgi:hypothetical protein